MYLWIFSELNNNSNTFKSIGLEIDCQVSYPYSLKTINGLILDCPKYFLRWFAFLRINFIGLSFLKPLILKNNQYLDVVSRLISVLPYIYIVNGLIDDNIALAILPPGKQLSITIDEVNWIYALFGCHTTPYLDYPTIGFVLLLCIM